MQRACLPLRRHVRQNHPAAERRADPPATLPWKYGFKSAKSIVKIAFTDKRPVNFWQELQDQRIRLLGQREPGRLPPALEPGARNGCSAPMRWWPTKIWNGYGEFVAPLYTNLKNERLFA
jgi:sulfoxide reductase catalytic subunit YedY